MLNSVTVFSSTLHLYVGNPTLYDGNNAVASRCWGSPFDVTTPLPLYSILCTVLLAKSFENAIAIYMPAKLVLHAEYMHVLWTHTCSTCSTAVQSGTPP